METWTSFYYHSPGYLGGTPSALSFGTASKARLAAHGHSGLGGLALQGGSQRLCG